MKATEKEYVRRVHSFESYISSVAVSRIIIHRLYILLSWTY